MNHPLIFEVQLWQWMAIFLLAFGGAWWLYGRGSGVGKKSTGSGLSWTGRIALGMLRALTLGGLAFLLLEPLWRMTQIEVENPVAVIVMDESTSVLQNLDSTESKDRLRQLVPELEAALQAQGMETEAFGFSDQLNARETDQWPTVDWNGEQTDLDAAIRDVQNRFENRNLAAIILATDGLFNRGAHPEFSASWPSAPLFTIGLGDTTHVRDRWIDRLDHNRIAYLGNTFPVQTLIQSQGLAGEPAEISIWQGGEMLVRDIWTPSTDREARQFDFTLPTREIGAQRYQLRCAINSRESRSENNRMTFYVEVLESKQKVVLLGRTVHPDIGAITEALTANANYEVRVFLANQPNTDPKTALDAASNADVIIAHDLTRSSSSSQAWANWVEQSEKPTWWMFASDDDIEWVQSHASLGLTMDASDGLTQRHQARLSDGFDLFDISKDMSESFLSWPPIRGPLGAVTLSPAWTPLFYRQLGPLQTTQAFWAFRDAPQTPRAVFCIGEGWWNWRMREYGQNNDHSAFEQLILRTTQFLAADGDQSRFRVKVPRRIKADERLVYSAEVYDATMAPAIGADASLQVTADDGTVFPQSFTEKNGRYTLDAGRLPPGSYSWTARCTMDQAVMEVTGNVIVEALHAERSSKPADHHLLLRLAKKHGGTFLGTPNNETAQLAAQSVVEAGIPNPILHEQVRLDDLIQWPWILVLLLSVLSMEWLIRRLKLGY